MTRFFFGWFLCYLGKFYIFRIKWIVCTGIFYLKLTIIKDSINIITFYYPICIA